MFARYAHGLRPPSGRRAAARSRARGRTGPARRLRGCAKRGPRDRGRAPRRLRLLLVARACCRDPASRGRRSPAADPRPPGPGARPRAGCGSGSPCRRRRRRTVPASGSAKPLRPDPEPAFDAKLAGAHERAPDERGRPERTRLPDERPVARAESSGLAIEAARLAVAAGSQRLVSAASQRPRSRAGPTAAHVGELVGSQIEPFLDSVEHPLDTGIHRRAVRGDTGCAPAVERKRLALEGYAAPGENGAHPEVPVLDSRPIRVEDPDLAHEAAWKQRQDREEVLLQDRAALLVRRRKSTAVPHFRSVDPARKEPVRVGRDDLRSASVVDLNERLEMPFEHEVVGIAEREKLPLRLRETVVARRANT